MTNDPLPSLTLTLWLEGHAIGHTRVTPEDAFPGDEEPSLTPGEYVMLPFEPLPGYSEIASILRSAGDVFAQQTCWRAAVLSDEQCDAGWRAATDLWKRVELRDLRGHRVGRVTLLLDVLMFDVQSYFLNVALQTAA